MTRSFATYFFFLFSLPSYLSNDHFGWQKKLFGVYDDLWHISSTIQVFILVVLAWHRAAGRFGIRLGLVGLANSLMFSNDLYIYIP